MLVAVEDLVERRRQLGQEGIAGQFEPGPEVAVTQPAQRDEQRAEIRGMERSMRVRGFQLRDHRGLLHNWRRQRHQSATLRVTELPHRVMF
jgi:hypothetical protein